MAQVAAVALMACSNCGVFGGCVCWGGSGGSIPSRYHNSLRSGIVIRGLLLKPIALQCMPLYALPCLPVVPVLARSGRPTPTA